MQDIFSAVNFAAIAHKDQRRKNNSSDPYINHCIEVANLLALAGVTDIEILQAAVLHDTVEDCGVTFEDLTTKFGKRVSDLVSECSDDKSLDKVTRKQTQIEHAKTISADAALIKIADKISNTRTLKSDPPLSWSPDVVRGYVQWAKMVCQNLNVDNEYLLNLFNSICIDHNIHAVTTEDLDQYYNLIN